MSKPTLAARLTRKFIVMSDDAAWLESLRAATPEGWICVGTADLAELGAFQDVLLHRFLFLDLDAGQFDAIAALRRIRMDMMLTLPVFGFGGTPALRDEARLMRADRIFGKDEGREALARFCEQFGW